MERRDLEELSAAQERVLKLSFQPALSKKRIRNIIVSSAFAALVVLAATYFDLGLVIMAIVAGAIAFVSVIEKITYTREMMVYKSLVRKLVHRVEQGEGQDLTPLGGTERLERPREPYLERAAREAR